LVLMVQYTSQTEAIALDLDKFSELKISNLSLNRVLL